MCDKEDRKTECRIPTVCGPECTPKSTTIITPNQGGKGRMMKTLAGGKHMCLIHTMACGFYGTPTPSLREPYINKNGDKDEGNAKKKTNKQPVAKFLPPHPTKDKVKRLQEDSPADLLPSEPKNNPPIDDQSKEKENQPSVPKKKPKGRSARQVCVSVSPIPFSEEISCCWSLKPLSQLGTSSGQPHSKANTGETEQSSQQEGPADKKSQSYFNKLDCESPKIMIKCSPSQQQPNQQTDSKARPVCPVKAARKRQQSPCVSSQKDLLTISINCSVSEKANSKQKLGEGEETQSETEDCSIECSMKGCMRAELCTEDGLISEKVISIQERLEEEVQWDDEDEEDDDGDKAT
ncbi:hypothetical protein Aperf_G00000125152 [Anoplocephala perfoliata]